MRKLYPAVLGFAVLACAGRKTLGAATISVTVPSTPQPVGATFTVSVQVSGATSLYAYQFDLEFNPSAVSAVSVSQGSFLQSGGSTVFIPGNINNTTGRITFTASTLIGPVSG